MCEIRVIDQTIGLMYLVVCFWFAVTGKLWPKVFEIRMIDQTSDPDTNMEKVRKSCIR